MRVRFTVSNLRFVEGSGPCRWAFSTTQAPFQLFSAQQFMPSPGLGAVEGTKASTRSWWVLEYGPKSICPLSGVSGTVQAVLTLSRRQEKSLCFCSGPLYFLASDTEKAAGFFQRANST